MVPNTDYYRFTPKVFLDLFNSEVVPSQHIIKNCPVTPLSEANQFGHSKKYSANEVDHLLKHPPISEKRKYQGETDNNRNKSSKLDSDSNSLSSLSNTPQGG
ncbi:unnamed protein product [Ambrosiozyma monospora]|uniref:Unnamed protein product n=1 Tax=Ambrosiozyma monospora TaxID=43982 RepID=A0A9W7DJ76_AMBMO|nr:unnamed protein product [Ambrosiozyma monospora]